MAQLDAMLRALYERGAIELRLKHGDRPIFRFADGERPVSQTVLSRAQITTLLAELADRDSAAGLAAGRPTRFTYRLPDGTAFLCEAQGNNGDFAARLVPQKPEAPATTRPAAPVTGGSAAEPATPVAVARPSSAVRSGAPEIDKYLMKVVEAGASDLHLSAGEVPMLRVQGDMARIEGEPSQSAESTLRLLREIMPERNQREFEETHDTDFAYEIPDVARFRVNAFIDRKGPGGVMRFIPSKLLTVEDLGLPQAVIDLCQMPKGLVLVTGPTGSGKSTTLAAMIDYINRNRTDHIITIEDPIEFVHPNRSCLINQREIGSHTDGFKKALRACLREDPDIVLVGEMRDLETVAIAIETAETGHLVFGTLHTTTAASTVDRVIDQFPADQQSQIRTMLSESIKGVVSQTLLKKTGGGRVAALEVLIVIPAIANLIREGKTFQIPSIMQTGKKYGMVLLNEALLNLVRKGLVAPEEAYRKAVDKPTLANQLQQAGFPLPSSGTDPA